MLTGKTIPKDKQPYFVKFSNQDVDHLCRAYMRIGQTFLIMSPEICMEMIQSCSLLIPEMHNITKGWDFSKFLLGSSKFFLHLLHSAIFGVYLIIYLHTNYELHLFALGPVRFWGTCTKRRWRENFLLLSSLSISTNPCCYWKEDIVGELEDILYLPLKVKLLIEVFANYPQYKKASFASLF